jgi:hypothetical protein
MTTRTRDKRVTFLRPFTIDGLEGLQPSGTYSVETREEHTRFFSFLKAKPTSTWIRVCQKPGIAGVLKIVKIDPFDLQTALARDVVLAE